MMLDAKHTPGPWIQVGHWVEHPNEKIPDICTCDLQAIGHGHLKRTEAETIANARLIAAAPDMLEALKLIQNQDLVLPADREIIKSAIAKATGESHE